MVLTPGDVFYIGNSIGGNGYAVLLELRDSRSNYGFLLAGLESLGSRVGEPEPYNKMVNFLRSVNARRITTLLGMPIQEYIAPMIRPCQLGIADQTAVYGTIYQYCELLYLAVSVTSVPARHTLIPLSGSPQWRGDIVNDNYRYDFSTPFGTVKHGDVWSRLRERDGIYDVR